MNSKTSSTRQHNSRVESVGVNSQEGGFTINTGIIDLRTTTTSKSSKTGIK